MKILVTGSEGSLMQAVIPHLLRAGHRVVGVDNFVRYGKIQRKRAYEFYEGDLTDIRLVERVMRGCGGVIQAAARIYGVGGFHKYPADILAHDLHLHQNVLWTALKYKIRKIAYISSSMVYERCVKYPCAEDDAFESMIPCTDYGLSKVVGERLCRAFFQQYGIQYVVWRPFNIITPYEKGEGEQGISHVFADFIRMILINRKNPMPIFGDGRQIRCFTWIDDVAKTIARWSFNKKTDNQAYNIGNPEPIRMKDLAKLIDRTAREMELLPKSASALRFKHVPIYLDDVKIRIPDVRKARRELGWAPTVKVVQAVRRCLASTPEVYRRRNF